jgi:hypothetical protein
MKTNSNLSQGRIERLEEIGFQLKVNGVFKKRYRELIAFKEEFGHCNTPLIICANNPSGGWCGDMRK